MTTPLADLLSLAAEAVDLTARDERFADWIAHGETAARRAEFLRYAATPGTSFSTCGLFLRGLLARWLGARRPVPRPLTAPYRAPWDSPKHGGAVADVLEAITEAGGAKAVMRWDDASVALVDPGVLLVVGEGRSTHILLVERVRDAYLGEVRYDAVEGGLVDPATGAQRIGRRRHCISDGWDGAGSSPWGDRMLGVARRVRWVLNPLALLEAP